MIRVVQFILGLLVSLLIACGGSSSNGEHESISNKLNFEQVESDVLRRCLEALAIEYNWQSNSDVKVIKCEPEDRTSYGWGVQTLEGVQLFTNLEELVVSSDSLYARQIKDILPLSGLNNLRVVELYNVATDSLEVLRGKPIESLTISPTYFSDMSPVAALSNLKFLYLGQPYIHYDQISDFSPLGELVNLEELHIYRQHYNIREHGLEFLETLTRLKVLNLRENFITNYNGLETATSLEELDLSYNRPFTFTTEEEQQQFKASMAALTNMKSFTSQAYDGQDIGFVEHWDNIEVLVLSEYDNLSQEELFMLAEKESLHELFLYGFRTADISSLSASSSLQVLGLGDGTIDSTTLSFQIGFPNLRELHLLDAFKYNTAPVENQKSYLIFKDLPALETLTVHKPWLADIESVTEIDNIRKLGLWESDITDVSFLTSMEGLVSLDLYKNEVSDILPLADLRQLEELFVEDTDVPCSNITSFNELAPNVEVITDRYCN